MLARLSAFVIWALVAATAVFWGLRLFVSAPAAPSYAVAVGDSGAVRSDLSRLLGAAPVTTAAAAAAPAASSRFRLLGIVAPKYASTADSPSHGVALIAIDGKMPKAYVVGSRVDGDMMLKAVSLRTVSIGGVKDSPAITLELPLPTAPATGTLTTTPDGIPAYVPPRPLPHSFVPPQAMAPLNMPPPVAQPVPPPAMPREPDQPK